MCLIQTSVAFTVPKSSCLHGGCLQIAKDHVVLCRMCAYVCQCFMCDVSVATCPQEKTYSRANEVAKLEKLMKFVREPLLDKDK